MKTATGDAQEPNPGHLKKADRPKRPAYRMFIIAISMVTSTAKGRFYASQSLYHDYLIAKLNPPKGTSITGFNARSIDIEIKIADNHA
jgi:hypothetical protein